MSSFSGKIKEYPQISVDRFDGRHLASTAYFLSHHHSDHMHGLSSPQFLDHLESNSGIYLYCSLITARFLQANIRYRPLSPFIHPLQVEESVKVTIPNIAEDASQHLWVTLIPAAHCPGSVMFLFEGRGGTVLYTGDFRISIGEAARIRPLHNSDGTVKTIDHLHIDTTFCHRDIMQFPSREESCTALLELIEDWLARGNNFLIHLIFPARYGYEFLFRGIHERFGMKIHVSRWKYRMYASVPEILDLLTLDATETWIHACDWRTNEADEGDSKGQKHLPCRCVPYGVDVEPNIRIIKPSAIYYTMYQSAKEIKQVSANGTFCRILLSMHASCSELLDLVSYLRPRKASPSVIPYNSTREEVLKLLHEALNRSGDHYSIEYVSNQRRTLTSLKRALDSDDSTCTASTGSSSMLEAGMLDAFMSSPNKRRRHSDSNMSLVLPNPRGNMKGSLSLEGECRHESNTCEPMSPVRETSSWVDPYTPSPTKSDSTSPKSTPDHEAKGTNLCDEDDNVFCDPTEPQRSSSSSAGVAGESSIKQSRKLWYKHKYFSTPIQEQMTRTKAVGPRSSSLPLPEHGDEHVPLITISSPVDGKGAESDSLAKESRECNFIPSITDRPSVICSAMPPPTTEYNGWINCNNQSRKRTKHRHSNFKRPKITLKKMAKVTEIIDLEQDSEDVEDTEGRSSCLKTTRRDHDQIQVISLEKSPL